MSTISQSKPRVGIVLVNYNGMKFMPECLVSLKNIDSAIAKVVVIDNASADGSADWAERNHPEVEVIRLGRNTGITGGNNAGIEWCLESGFEYVFLLNNDTVVNPDLVTQLIKHADENTLTVPKIYFHDRKELINNHIGAFSYWRGIHVDWFYRETDTPASSCIREATMANTCALLIPRKIIERIGLMDDKLFIYYDDTDFITRAVRCGAKIRFVPDAVLYHKESSSTGGGESALTVYYQTRNRLYFCVKHNRSRPDRLLFSLFYSVSTRAIRSFMYILRGQRRLAKAVVNGSVDFLFSRMGYADPKRFT